MKKLFLSALLTSALYGCASTSTVSEATPAMLKVSPGWIADQNSGCQIWQPSSEEGQTVSWSGQCENQLAEGQGTLVRYQAGKEDNRYEGRLHKGKEEGKGVLTWRDGSRYEGGFHKGKLHGQGVMTLNDGTQYQQQYRHGKPIGQAMVTLMNGQRLTGTYLGN